MMHDPITSDQDYINDWHSEPIKKYQTLHVFIKNAEIIYWMKISTNLGLFWHAVNIDEHLWMVLEHSIT